MTLSPGELRALQNLARKSGGEEVDWINIADARALTGYGFAERTREGWSITPAGTAALLVMGSGPQPDSGNDT